MFTSTLSTTATTKKRKADKERVERGLGLPECGESVEVEITTPGGYKIAEGYVRVVYGDRGPYIELEQGQIAWENFHPGRERKPCHYYAEWFSLDGVKLYDQLRIVKYADYRVGMIYVDPYDIRCALNLREKTEIMS